MHSRLGSAFSDSEDMRDLAQPKNYALNVIARLRPGLTMDRRNRDCRFCASGSTPSSRPIPRARAISSSAVAFQYQHFAGR